MSRDPLKTHLGSILFIYTRVAVDVASKEKALLETGNGCHLKDVKIISWIGLNEKLMDFKGKRELIFAPTPIFLGVGFGSKRGSFPPRC